MSRLGFAIACGLLLAGTAAQAQSIENLTTSAGTTVVYPLVVKLESYGQTNPAGTSTLAPFGGTNFTSFVTNSGGQISFESSDVDSGLNVQTFSNTQVGFTFTNDTGDDVQFNSLITAAGLGFYLADVTPACAFSSCDEVSGVGLLSDVQRLNPFAAAGVVGFDFAIRDNGEDLFHVVGQTSLDYTQGGAAFFNDLFGTGTYLNGTGAMGLLKNFHLASSATDAAAHGFAWDATPVSFLLGGGTHNITYSTSVFSATNALQLDCGASLVAYSGFGDPIGQSGSVENVDAFSIASADFGSFATTSGCPADGPIKGLTFTPTTYDTPVFKDGVLTYGNTDSVPEPATWAMMILGFGSIGAMMRRRRLAGGLA